MCTAISDGNIFGRTLDLEYTLDEEIIETDAGLEFKLIHDGTARCEYNIHGCGIKRNGFPLYYDAANESGLAMAALNFPISAKYCNYTKKARMLASFEVIPAVLASCENLGSAIKYLSDVRISDDSFSKKLPVSKLHWMLADKSGAAVLESTEGGIHIYENPFGILTNEPEFPYHRANAAFYMSLSPTPPTNTLCPDIPLPYISHSLGALGLPGDNSSPSRFIRALYNLKHTIPETEPNEKINRFFHIAATVSQPNGTSYTPDGKPIKTVYTVCYDLDRFEIYLKKY